MSSDMSSDMSHMFSLFSPCSFDEDHGNLGFMKTRTMSDSWIHAVLRQYKDSASTKLVYDAVSSWDNNQGMWVVRAMFRWIGADDWFFYCFGVGSKECRFHAVGRRVRFFRGSLMRRRTLCGRAWQTSSSATTA